METKSNAGKTALDISKKYKHEDVYRFLLARQEERAEKDRAMQEWLSAIKRGDAEALRALLAKGADVNMAQSNGMTGLMCACREGKLRMVKLLAEAGADVNAVDSKGGTALFYACMKDHEDIARYLVLEAGADVQYEDENGYTALTESCGKSHESIARFLAVEAGASVGWAFHEACAQGHLSVVRMLAVEAGADLEFKPTRGFLKGKTPLDAAKSVKHREIATYLTAKIKEQRRERKRIAHAVLTLSLPPQYAPRSHSHPSPDLRLPRGLRERPRAAPPPPLAPQRHPPRAAPHPHVPLRPQLHPARPRVRPRVQGRRALPPRAPPEELPLTKRIESTRSSV